jgi:DDE superfamily endonuclease
VAEAEKEQRVIVFVDESGFSQRPARKRTWAPRGQTPILEFNFNWKRISAIAGVSFYELWFALHEGTIRAPQVIEFVQQLRARIGKKLLLVSRRAAAAHQPGSARLPGLAGWGGARGTLARLRPGT